MKRLLIKLTTSFGKCFCTVEDVKESAPSGVEPDAEDQQHAAGNDH